MNLNRESATPLAGQQRSRRTVPTRQFMAFGQGGGHCYWGGGLISTHSSPVERLIQWPFHARNANSLANIGSSCSEVSRRPSDSEERAQGSVVGVKGFFPESIAKSSSGKSLEH